MTIENFVWQWQTHHSWIREQCTDVKSVDMTKYLKGLEHFYQMQMASKGLQ